MLRYNKYGRGIIFTDPDNKPIDEDDGVEYDPNTNHNPEENVFNFNDYFPDNFPERVNDGDDTYENTYENPNFGDKTTTHLSKKTSNTRKIMTRNLPTMSRVPTMGMMMIIITNTPKMQDCTKKPPKLQEWTRKLQV